MSSSPHPSSTSLPHYEVVAAAVEQGGRYLLGRRPADASQTGDRWEFPGGKVKPGETHAGALARELREELAIDVVVGAKLASIDHVYRHARLSLHLYVCEVVGGEPEARFHSALKWFPRGELDRTELSAADRKLLKHV